jgi:hypothetical protein
MKIIISDGEDLTDTFVELVTVLNNMRHWQKEWGIHYGCALLNKRKFWEEKADKLLQRLSSTEYIEQRDKVIIEQKIK